MRRTALIGILFAMFFLLAACSPASDPAAAVTQYFNALAAKDANRLSVLSCADWAPKSQELLDSITSVDVKLNSLACETLDNDGKNASVKCTGTLNATYNNENQTLDLSTSTYVMVNQKGDWLVCGQK